MATWQKYLAEHQGRFLAEFKEFLAIPSISTDPQHTPDVHRAAEWVAERLRAAGFKQAELHETEGHPIVFGSWLDAPGRPTVLIYGHFDVQPPEPLELWQTPPFSPEVREDGSTRGARVT